jgi:hypothetical protein
MLTTALDSCGPTWTVRASGSRSADVCGRSWTSAILLRIRRLGVRSPPAAPKLKPHSDQGMGLCLWPWEPRWEPHGVMTRTEPARGRRRRPLVALQQVSVHVLGDRDAGVAQDLGDHVQRCAPGRASATRRSANSCGCQWPRPAFRHSLEKVCEELSGSIGVPTCRPLDPARPTGVRVGAGPSGRAGAGGPTKRRAPQPLPAHHQDSPSVPSTPMSIALSCRAWATPTHA